MAALGAVLAVQYEVGEGRQSPKSDDTEITTNQHPPAAVSVFNRSSVERTRWSSRVTITIVGKQVEPARSCDKWCETPPAADRARRPRRVRGWFEARPHARGDASWQRPEASNSAASSSSTSHQQQEARNRLEAGETQLQCCPLYNVSQSTISRL